MSPANPITISQLAAALLGRAAVTGEDFAKARQAMLGGCEICHATIAAYNAYPASTGNWRCADCIGDLGYMSIEEARRAIFGERLHVTGTALDHRQCATVLAALRYWQQEIVEAGREVPEHFDHFDDGTTPLDATEIEALCERINLGPLPGTESDQALFCTECEQVTAHEDEDHTLICRACGNDYDADDAAAFIAEQAAAPKSA